MKRARDRNTHPPPFGFQTSSQSLSPSINSNICVWCSEMPLKSGKSRASNADWSWAGTEVQNPDQITEHHRRRAAGLVGGSSCPYRFQQSIDTKDQSDDSIKVIKDSTCTARRCRGSHLCYNHLGAEQVRSTSLNVGTDEQLVESGAKEAFIANKLDDGLEMKDGPPGLQNLGATCYVSVRNGRADRRRMHFCNYGITISPSEMAFTIALAPRLVNAADLADFRLLRSITLRSFSLRSNTRIERSLTQRVSSKHCA